MKLINDIHKHALDRLEKLIDPVHVERTEQLHQDLWDGKALPYLPCVMGGIFDEPGAWPIYSFVENWDDIEKNFMTSLLSVYNGAKLRDDRLYQVRAEYGVVNIPELFNVESQISNEGRSMSEGLNDADAVRRLVDAGIPNFSTNPHCRKVVEFEQFAKSVLSQYENLSRHVHITLPDTQGPFDLACLIWGCDIFIGLYDHPQLVSDLMELVTKTFIAYNHYHKAITGEPRDSAYHIAGLKLVHGGVRICDDSATLLPGDTYRELVKPYNEKAFAAFNGGWLHYCGNGNHILDAILETPGVNALHLGNPDDHDFLSLLTRTTARNTVLYWSGALENIAQAREICNNSRLLVLVENRYAPKNFKDAELRLEKVRNYQTIEKAAW